MVRQKKMPPSIAALNDLPAVNHAMAQVFQDAQMNLSSHRKLVVVLRNIHLRAIELGLQSSFNFTFTKLINMMLPLKKGEQAADKTAKFCSAFVSTTLKEEQKQKENAKTNNGDEENEKEEEEEEEDEEDTPGSELVEFLIRHLLRGTGAKDRNVRYRVVQLLAYLVNYITEIDEELFRALHYTLKSRLKDRESTVRIQAVVAISRFQFFELIDEEADDHTSNHPQSQMNSATKSLLLALENDDSPEVRRAALLNLVKNTETIPYLIERARDVNAINRRLVYTRVLKEIQDFREIDVDLRQKVLNWGLHDRDERVKQAATNMLTHNWSEVLNDDLLELIENLNIVGSEVAENAMTQYYKARQDKTATIKISDNDWKELTTEKAFLIRTYYQHCRNNKLHDIIDTNFPELSDLAKILEKYLELRQNTVNPKRSMIDQYERYVRDLEKLDQIIRTEHLKGIEVSKSLTKHDSQIQEQAEKKRDAEAELMNINRDLAALRSERKKINKKKNPQDAKLLELEESIEEKKSILKELKIIIKDLESFLSRDADTRQMRKNKMDEHESNVAKYLVIKQERVRAILELQEDYQPFMDTLKDLEFIIEQLLLIIKEYDFDDVIGSRRMLPIIRTYLTNGYLPEDLIKVSTNILRKISTNENDFASLCIEVITDIRDSQLDENNETFHSAASMLRPNNGTNNLLDSDDEEGGNSSSRIEGDILNSEVNESRYDSVPGSDNKDSSSHKLLESISEADHDEEQLKSILNDGENDDDKEEEEKQIEANDDEDEDGDEDVDQASKRRRIDPELPFEIMIQCLMILKHYLILIEDPVSNMPQNDSLATTLINPAITSDDLKIKNYGFRCLGLFSLLDKNAAIENLKILGFAAAAMSHTEELKTIAIEGIFDLLATYGVSILDDNGSGKEGVDSLSLGRLFYSLLRDVEYPSLQATVAEGLCKLFLADLLVDFGKGSVTPEARTGADYEQLVENQQEIQLLEALVIAYFHPDNYHNYELKQTLAFCLPVYAFSHPHHQAKLVEISGDCLYRIFRNHSSGSEVEGEDAKTKNLQTPSMVINQLINWCDPNNVVNQDESQVRQSTSHFWQAIKFLQVVEQDSPKAVKRTIVSNLNKLFITEDLGSTILTGLAAALEDTKKHLDERKQDDNNFALDAITERNFEKFEGFVQALIQKAEANEVKIQEEKERKEKDLELEEESVVKEADSADGEHDDGGELKRDIESHVDIDGDKAVNDEEPRSGSPKSDIEVEDEEAEDDPSEGDKESTKQKAQAAELDEIDQLLEEEGNVEYDIDISMDDVDGQSPLQGKYGIDKREEKEKEEGEEGEEEKEEEEEEEEEGEEGEEQHEDEDAGEEEEELEREGEEQEDKQEEEQQEEDERKVQAVSKKQSQNQSIAQPKLKQIIEESDPESDDNDASIRMDIEEDDSDTTGKEDDSDGISEESEED